MAMKKMLSVEEQERRARLISPYFRFLNFKDSAFLVDVENMRVKYGISSARPAINNIPLHLLHQKYWNRDFSSMVNVKSYPPELVKLWQEFHEDIELLAKKYRLSNFLYLTKEFILTGRFGNALINNEIVSTEGRHTITLSQYVKKKDFDKIWAYIEKFNSDHPIKRSYTRSYTDETMKKYELVEQIGRKYNADQNGIRLLVKKEMLGDLTPEEKKVINDWDKYKKSRLNRLAQNLISLITDIDEAKR